MAYEVIKTIGGRQYRYEVRSERDPATGKTRNRWTYIGRVVGGPDVAKVPTPRTNARLKLLDAAQRLLENGEPSAVSADSIARAAGVAHGTFYRYFRDRSDALEALARHLLSSRAAVDDGLLRDDVTAIGPARAAVRTWIVEKLRGYGERRSSLRAWHALVATDLRLAAYREERRDSTLRRLAEHLAYLTSLGLAQIARPEVSAAAIMAFVDGIVRATLLDTDSLDDAFVSAAADIVERAIFANLDP